MTLSSNPLSFGDTMLWKRIEKQRNVRRVADEDRLGLGKKLRALARVCFRAGLGHQVIVFGIGVEGIVAAVAGDKQAEEGLRILVVGDPAGAGNVIIAMLLQIP